MLDIDTIQRGMYYTHIRSNITYRLIDFVECLDPFTGSFYNGVYYKSTADNKGYCMNKHNFCRVFTDLKYNPNNTILL